MFIAKRGIWSVGVLELRWITVRTNSSMSRQGVSGGNLVIVEGTPIAVLDVISGCGTLISHHAKVSGYDARGITLKSFSSIYIALTGLVSGRS